MVEHEPVLLQKVVDSFLPMDGVGLLCDATLGGGGHTAHFLKQFPSCRVVGIDADRDMLGRARQRLGDTGRVEYVHGWFDDVLAVRTGFDRILIDLGVSMVHMKSGERGFSLHTDGPLDMRLDTSGGGETAEQFIRRCTERDLADTIFRYGEERYSRRIAAAIIRERDRGIPSTGTLAEIVRRAVPPAYRRGRTHPATRTFQALRIAVNHELDRLERVIPRAAVALNPGGRLAIISFHSLEDRIVKHRFREYRDAPILEETGSTGGASASVVRYRVMTKKPIVPDEEEVRRNPASRSARMRVLERSAER